MNLIVLYFTFWRLVIKHRFLFLEMLLNLTKPVGGLDTLNELHEDEELKTMQTEDMPDQSDFIALINKTPLRFNESISSLLIIH